jgi:beta-xylosidase
MAMQGRFGRFAAATAGTVARLVTGVVPAIASAPTSATFRSPVYPGDFPDPSILLSAGEYWAYATGSGGLNLQVMTSPDLRSWTRPADPLPVLPPWASPRHTWAPDVMAVDTRFVMYYTVRDTALDIQCISVATSATPRGPFTDASAGPLVCQAANGGSIDPNAYLDPVSGNLYLLWKSDDNSIGKPTHIWGQRLAPGGLSFYPGTTPARLLTESESWQHPRAEGPTIIRRANRYYLFYGANNYDTANSGIGYATSPSLLSPYTNQSRDRAWLGTTGRARGPQGPMLFRDSSGATRMAFAAWYGAAGYRNGGFRSLWIGTLDLDPSGTPSLS